MTKKIVIFFLSLSFLMTSLWFSGEKIFATAEEGIIFHNPELTFSIYSQVWQHDGPGSASPAMLPQAPLMYLASLLHKFLGNFLIQRVIYLFLIFNALTSSYFIYYKLSKEKLSSFIAALFYFFNLFVMSQIFARSLFIGIVLWSFLPLFTLLSIKFLERPRFKYLLLFFIANLLFGFSYGLPTSIIVLWAPVGLYSLFSKKIKNTLILCIFWMVINLWWLYPYLTISPESFSVALDQDKSFESLQAVSSYFPLTEILQLRHKFFFDIEFNPKNLWGDYYSSFSMKILSITATLLTSYGIYISRFKKYFLQWFTLILIAVFISKGTNFPFGELFYKFGFKFVPFFSIFRNPYEKLGLLIVLPYSFFFAKGLLRFCSKQKYSIHIFVILLVLVFGMLTKPYWNGDVFPSNAWVTVPEYYDDLNNYLKDNKDSGRILVLPMIPDHGIQYEWGYSGDEPIRFLVKQRAISRLPKVPIYAEKYLELKEAVESVNIKKLEILFNELAINYILVNKDIDPSYGFPIDIKSLTGIDHKFGNLILYEVKDKSNIIELEESENGLEIKKATNQRYIANINAENETKLILKETFNKRWKAYSNGQELPNHQMAYGYANSWEVPEGEHNIEFIFEIY